jgi:hypothetical protein
LLTRPGTTFCGAVKDETLRPELLPFVFSEDQSYVIESGDKNFRVRASDGALLKAESVVALGGFSGAGTIMWRSNDVGVTWDTPTPPITSTYKAVCQAANGRLVAVGPIGLAALSDDGGTTWRYVPAGGVTGLGVAFNGRTLLSVGGAMGAISHDNGETWQGYGFDPSTTSWTASMSGVGVSWGNGRWIMVGTTISGAVRARYAYSYDGENWGGAYELDGLDAAYATSQLKSVCFVSGAFLCVGYAGTTGIYATIGVLDANAKWGTLGSNLVMGVATDGAGHAKLVGGSVETNPRSRVWSYDSGSGLVSAPEALATSSLTDDTLEAVCFHRGSWVAVGKNSVVRVLTGSAWSTSVQAGDPRTFWTVCSGAGAEVLEVSTPYTVGAQLNHAQSGDVLTLFNKYLPPKELRRYGLFDWRLEDWYKVPPTRKVTGLAFTGTPDQTGDSLHPPKAWKYVVTWEDEETGRESLACAALVPGSSGKIVLYPDKPIGIQWDAISKASRYYVYRGRNDEWGYVGSVKQPTSILGTAFATVYFNDDGQIPVTSEDPPSWSNPFQSDLSYPVCGCYFGDRLVVGGSLVQPHTVKGSAVADYYDFDEHFITDAEDAYEFTLTARRYEEIKWIVPLEALIVGTSEGEWLLSGSGEEALSPVSVHARERSTQGSGEVPPVVVGDGVLYLQPGHQGVRDFAFQEASSQWGGQDRTVYSGHLFKGHSIVSWAFQQKPNPTVWAVRDDGVLLSLACVRELNMWAWARHDTDGGLFERVCVVPNGEADKVFFVVKRGAQRNIETLDATPSTTTSQLRLDCKVTLTYGYPQPTITGLPFQTGTAYVIADGVALGAFTVVAGGSIFINNGNSYTTFTVGLLSPAQFGTLDFPSEHGKRKTISGVGVEFTSLAPSDVGVQISIGEAPGTESLRYLTDAENTVLSVPVDTSTNPGGRCSVTFSGPTFLEIRGVTREVS